MVNKLSTFFYNLPRILSQNRECFFSSPPKPQGFVNFHLESRIDLSFFRFLPLNIRKILKICSLYLHPRILLNYTVLIFFLGFVLYGMKYLSVILTSNQINMIFNSLLIFSVIGWPITLAFLLHMYDIYLSLKLKFKNKYFLLGFFLR